MLNTKYIKYSLKLLINLLSINNSITSNNINIHKKDTSISISIRGLVDVDDCDKVISKIKDNLSKLGYYLSYKIDKSYGIILCGDDGLDIQIDYAKVYYEICLHIKKKFVSRKKQPRYLYHGTFERNVDGILANGLLTNKLTNYNEGIHLDYDKLLFLSSDLDYIMYKYDRVIKVDTWKLSNKWYSDLNLPYNESLYMTDTNIPKQAIVEVKSI